MNQQNPKNTLLINILGNSLAMPFYSHNINYEDTYSFILAHLLRKDNIVVNKARRNMTIVEQTSDTNIQDDILSINAEYYIVQLGITDCAPRLFTRRQGKYLGLVPGHKFIIAFMSKHRYFFTKKFPKVYVKKDKFRERYCFLLETILGSTKSEKIFVIKIPKPTDKIIKRSFGIEKNIKAYNLIIEEVTQKFPNDVVLIDLYEMTRTDSKLMSEDGIHITKKAHQILANLICQQIENQ